MRTLVIVDDHAVLRESLQAALNGSNVAVVGVAADARQAFTVVADTDPDAVLLDVMLPGIDGISAAHELRRRSTRTKVLMFSMHDRSDFVARAFAAGALGYALKTQTLQDITDAVEHVASGRVYLAPGLSPSLAEARWRHDDVTDPLHPLSNREKEIFHLVVRGFSNENIAAQLAISVKTVETHRAHINRKLGAHCPADLVRFAATRGLFVPEPEVVRRAG